MGTVFDQIDAVLSLAAALSVQSPFTNWAHRDPDCVVSCKNSFVLFLQNCVNSGLNLCPIGSEKGT